MKQLFLEDLAPLSDSDIRTYLIDEYGADNLLEFEILIAYESVGRWGCDSSSYFLLKHITSGLLYENHASHCSCYGFEGQWVPEETHAEYLKSDKFYLPVGGYDESLGKNDIAVKAYIAEEL